jgi:hypothetical protein
MDNQWLLKANEQQLTVDGYTWSLKYYLLMVDGYRLTLNNYLLTLDDYTLPFKYYLQAVNEYTCSADQWKLTVAEYSCCVAMILPMHTVKVAGVAMFTDAHLHRGRWFLRWEAYFLHRGHATTV